MLYTWLGYIAYPQDVLHDTARIQQHHQFTMLNQFSQSFQGFERNECADTDIISRAPSQRAWPPGVFQHQRRCVNHAGDGVLCKGDAHSYEGLPWLQVVCAVGVQFVTAICIDYDIEAVA